MRISGMTKTAWMLAAGFILALAGCSDAQKQDWNEFWGVNSGPKRGVKSSPKQQGTETRKASADRPATKEARPADAPNEDGGNPGDVDKDINAYSAQMNPKPRETANQPNDHNSKIRRQHDPERQKRIQDAAAKEHDADQPQDADQQVASDAQVGALKRYEDNTGVRAGDEETETDEPAESAEVSAPSSGDKKPIVMTASDRKNPAAKSATRSDTVNQRDPEISVDADSDSQDEPVAEKPAIHANATPVDSEASTPAPAANGKSQSGVPELADITISEAPAPEAAPVADEPKPVETLANSSGAPINAEPTFNSRIDEQEKLVSTDPNNLEEQYRLRMMYLIDGQDEKAKAEIPGVDADLQQIIGAQIASLISARSTSGRDPATWATRQLESIEELRRLVKERADLVVTKVALCTAVEGFGRYKPIEPAEFKAGKKHRVVIYIEIDNFSCKPLNSGMFRTLLSVRQTLLTKDGKEIWSEKADNIEDLARRPRRDFYLCTTPIAIPKTLPPGDYLLKAEVEDVLAGKINSGVATFEIVP